MLNIFSRYFIPVWLCNECLYLAGFIESLVSRLTNIYCNLGTLIIHKTTRNLLCLLYELAIEKIPVSLSIAERMLHEHESLHAVNTDLIKLIKNRFIT